MRAFTQYKQTVCFPLPTSDGKARGAMSAGSTRFLLLNGVPQTGDVPPLSSFLLSTSGAYTTTRTHGAASSVLFWDRHLARLAQSVQILAQHRPRLLGPAPQSKLDISSAAAAHSVNRSLQIGRSLAYHERARRALTDDLELAITALVTTKEGVPGLFDVFLHIGFYAPPVFGTGGACLAVAGPGRDLALAKYSDWVR